MSIASPQHALDALDAKVLLDMMRLQLNWLERQMAALQQVLHQGEKPATSQRTFKSLRGAWAGVVVSEEDLEAARITLPGYLRDPVSPR